MDPYVRRLIQRLNDPSQPLSRNRHFHTFDNPEGRYALKTSKRLRALQRDILASLREGLHTVFTRRTDGNGLVTVELTFERVRGRRTSMLRDAEFELLCEMPGVAEALREAA